MSCGSRIQSGNLKMATGRDDSVQDFHSGNDENNVEIRFFDGDDFPGLPNVMEHGNL